MTLTSGARLGPYEIVAPLGAGGMGEVYRAHDPKLHRDVAIKILPDALAADPAAFARFEREAQAVAALSHPNILGIHDFGVERGIPYAVMELLEGHTLREQLRDAALPPRKAIEYASQIAHGLAAAHEKGITHRDLKPENVFVTREGRVKILDFGLAKTTGPAKAGHHVPDNHGVQDNCGVPLPWPEPRRRQPDLSALPTMTADTAPGTVLGTLGYMAPEQVRGQAVDHRADIFAFGAILYEMLSGQRSFKGDTAADTISAILTKEPPELSARVAGISPGLDRIVRHCLEKEAGERFSAIADVAFALSELTQLPTPVPARGRRSVAIVAAMVLMAVVTAAATFLVTRRAAPAASGNPTVRLSMLGTITKAFETGGHRPLAFSPDGATVVYVMRQGDTSLLFLRHLNQLEPVALRGTEGGQQPFFSPDGRWIGFTADGRLKKIRVDGGAPEVIADAPHLHGAAWGSNNDIYFVPSQTSTGIWHVSADGGSVTRTTTVDAAAGEVLHEWPALLPDGKTLLVSVVGRAGSFEQAHIEARRTADGRRVASVESGYAPSYLPSGHLAFVRDGTLFVERFDAATLKPLGPAVRVAGVWSNSANGDAYYALSRDNVVYQPGKDIATVRRLVSVGRDGTERPLTDAVRFFQEMNLSPDAQLLTVSQYRGEALWNVDVTRGTMTRLTGEEFWAISPRFSPDGSLIAFIHRGPAGDAIEAVATSGAASRRTLLPPGPFRRLGSWEPSGSVLLYDEVNRETGEDVWALSVRDGQRTAIVATRANERQPVFSADGRAIAYVSTESGKEEVYVRPYPAQGPAIQVSSSGGVVPAWISGTGELAYVGDGQLWVARVETTPGIKAALPRSLFRAPYVTGNANFAVTRDGQRFFFVKAEFPPSEALVVITGIQHELARMAGAQQGGTEK